MKLALLLGAVALLGGLPWVLRALRAPDNTVTPDWLVDNDRRAWGDGIDGVSWRWPVRKIENEQGWRQTERLRRPA